MPGESREKKLTTKKFTNVCFGRSQLPEVRKNDAKIVR
jgi:hypothetical protein